MEDRIFDKAKLQIDEPDSTEILSSAVCWAKEYIIKNRIHLGSVELGSCLDIFSITLGCERSQILAGWDVTDFTNVQSLFSYQETSQIWRVPSRPWQWLTKQSKRNTTIDPKQHSFLIWKGWVIVLFLSISRGSVITAKQIRTPMKVK